MTTIIIRKVHSGDLLSRLQQRRQRSPRRRSSDASGAERCTDTPTFSRFISGGPALKDDLNRSEEVAPCRFGISARTEPPLPVNDSSSRQTNRVPGGLEPVPRCDFKPELKRCPGTLSSLTLATRRSKLYRGEESEKVALPPSALPSC